VHAYEVHAYELTRPGQQRCSGALGASG
jgi:hypothetical protein